jgi:hypothetical protein
LEEEVRKANEELKNIGKYKVEIDKWKTKSDKIEKELNKKALELLDSEKTISRLKSNLDNVSRSSNLQDNEMKT